MPSFDVVSRVDMQELDNAVNMVRKEVAQRYDFRGSKADVELDRKEGAVSFLTEDEMKLRALREMLLARAVKRGIDTKAFDFKDPQRAGGDMMRQEVDIATGLNEEVAKRIVKAIKGTKMKVQSSIQGDEVRITGKKRDDLQEVISFLKEQDFAVPLQFVNFRD